MKKSQSSEFPKESTIKSHFFSNRIPYSQMQKREETRTFYFLQNIEELWVFWKLKQQRRWKLWGQHYSHIKEVQIKHLTDQAFIAFLKPNWIFKVAFRLFPSFRTCRYISQDENIQRPLNYSILPNAFEDWKKCILRKRKT